MIRKLFITGALCLAGLAPAAGLAQGAKKADDDAAAKFRLEGARLVYDTENVPEGVEDAITAGDADALFALPQENTEITVLELNSSGGSNWGARRMADIIIDHGLDTHVNGECESSCTHLFLGGTKRTMSAGSRMGFHQSWWSVGSIERYYTRNSEAEGWATPFDFAGWMYLDTQNEVHDLLRFMVERGVNPNFAIETIGVSPDDMWRPYRVRLLLAGVLTE